LHNVFAKSSPIPTKCESPDYSFYFDLISPLWESCLAEGAIHRLCSLMRKMGVKTLVEEELEPNTEISYEFEDLEKQIKTKLIDPKAIRISFFSCPYNKEWWTFPPDSFLGYAVILKAKLPDKDSSKDISYILESVTRPPGWAKDETFKQVTNYYIHCHKDFLTTIGTKEQPKDYTIEGVFFCQQNGLTHVCAHAALRMMLNTRQELIGHKITNRELNDILKGEFPAEFAAGLFYKGLRPYHMKVIADSFNLHILPADFLMMATVDYAEWIYPLIESGFPVLLAFYPTHEVGHVVAIFGHTLNSDKWDCEAHLAYRPEAFGTYHASSAWVDHFIINDDNFGMYTCMPPAYLRNKLLPQYDQTQRAAFALALLPANTDATPYFAEKSSRGLVKNLKKFYKPTEDNKWLCRLWEQLQQANKGIVARTVICTKDAYIKSLKPYLPAEYSIPEPLLNCSEDIIVTEISLPDLYTCNKHKLGDVVSDGKTVILNGSKYLRFIWGWLPGIQIPEEPKETTIPSEWPIKNHIPLFRHPNTLNPCSEW